MDLTHYVESGYGGLFIETTEIKRAVRSIRIKEGVGSIYYWNSSQGLVQDFYNHERKNTQYADPLEILRHAAQIAGQKTILVLENFDHYLGNAEVVQLFSNCYMNFKANQTLAVVVGNNPQVIPNILKEMLPIIEFGLPTVEEIEKLANGVTSIFTKGLEQSIKEGKIPPETAEKADFSVTPEIIEACRALTVEEIENVLALSCRTKLRMDVNTVLERKRSMLRQTKFMDFIQPEPIENIGGLDNIKCFFEKRREPFVNPDSIKPKVRAVMLVGVPGCGKSLMGKIACSIFKWPGIIFDVGAVKDQYLGQTGAKLRAGQRIIDAFGNAVVVIDEMEKAFEQTESGSGQQSHGGGAITDMIGTMLTWMQERKSEGIVLATCNNINALPPEFKRAGRWDRIFAVDFPTPPEIETIVDIKNRQWKSNLPKSESFISKLYKDRWTGSEIEQLAKDVHYDGVDHAMSQIPLLSKNEEQSIDKIRESMGRYTPASKYTHDQFIETNKKRNVSF